MEELLAEDAAQAQKDAENNVHLGEGGGKKPLSTLNPPPQLQSQPWPPRDSKSHRDQLVPAAPGARVASRRLAGGRGAARGRGSRAPSPLKLLGSFGF